MATPPFLPDETKPGSSDLVSLYPNVEHTFRDIIESWLLIEHNTSGTHKQLTLDDIAEPTIAATLVGIWHESGVLKTRFAGGTVYDVMTSLTGIPSAGGTMTGDLFLAGAPTVDLEAATKKYVDDSVISGGAPLASPLFTGDPRGPTPSSNDNDTSLATTAYVTTAVAAAGTITAYDSGNQTWTAGGFKEVSHGLGGIPTQFQVNFVCTSTDNGWAVGDELQLDTEKNNSNATSNAQMASATKLRISITANPNPVSTKDGTSSFAMTPSKWKVRFRAIRVT